MFRSEEEWADLQKVIQERKEAKARAKNIKLEPMKPNTRGILVSYQGHQVNTNNKVAIEALKLLNDHVASAPHKYKPQHGKSICFEQKDIERKSMTCLFIETNVEDPYTLVDDIFTDMFASRTRKVDLCKRFYPVEVVYNNSEDIIAMVKKLVASRDMMGGSTCKLNMFGFRGTAEEKEKFTEAIVKNILPSSNFTNVVKNPNLHYVLEINIINEVCCVTLLESKFALYSFSKTARKNSKTARKNAKAQKRRAKAQAKLSKEIEAEGVNSLKQEQEEEQQQQQIIVKQENAY